MSTFSSLSNQNQKMLWAITAATGLLSTAAALYHLNLSVPRKGEAPVRWSWLPFLGWALELGKRPIELLAECKEMYGEIFGIVIGGNRTFFITDPFSATCVLRPTKELSSQEFHDSILMNFFGVTKFTIDAKLDENIIRKFYSQYLLSDKYLHLMTVRMQRQLMQDVSAVTEGPKRFYDFLSRFIFHASVAAMFNESAGNDRSLYEAFLAFDKEMALTAAGLPLEYFPKAVAGRSTLLEACATHLSNLSELMLRRWELFNNFITEGKMDVSDAPKEQLAMLWASVGNTMPATFWMIYFLLTNEEALDTARKEIADVLQDNISMERDVAQEQLNEMVFIDACITEALRLTSGSLIMRIAKEDLQLTLQSGNTYKFRKGDRIGICPPLFHLDEEIFPEAKSFCPSRWIRGDTKEENLQSAQGRIPLFKAGKELQSATTFLPFGSGVTLCPGRRFARNEIKILLVFLLNKFDLKILDKSQTIAMDGGRAGIGIFPPLGDIDVQVNKKN